MSSTITQVHEAIADRPQLSITIKDPNDPTGAGTTHTGKILGTRTAFVVAKKLNELVHEFEGVMETDPVKMFDFTLEFLKALGFEKAEEIVESLSLSQLSQIIQGFSKSLERFTLGGTRDSTKTPVLQTTSSA